MRSSDLVQTRLPVRRRGGRFDIEAVDDFLDRCTRAISAQEHGRQPELTAQDVVAVQFPTVALFTPGYDSDAVDEVLDEVAAQLREGSSSDGEPVDEYAAMHGEVDGLGLSAESAAAMHEMLERAKRAGERRSR